MSEAELREHFGEALVPGRRSLTVLGPPAKETTRLSVFHRQVASEEVAWVEYELFDDRVFRLRWCLAERFELPVYSNLTHRAGHYLGEPQLDKLVGEDPHTPAHEAPVLRHSVWRRGERSLELRQINPLTGGPVFLTLTDGLAFKEAKAAHEPVLRPPDAMEMSWRKVHIPSDDERWLLAWAFEDVLLPVARGLTPSPPKHSP